MEMLYFYFSLIIYIYSFPSVSISYFRVWLKLCRFARCPGSSFKASQTKYDLSWKPSVEILSWTDRLDLARKKDGIYTFATQFLSANPKDDVKHEENSLSLL